MPIDRHSASILLSQKQQQVTERPFVTAINDDGEIPAMPHDKDVILRTKQLKQKYLAQGDGLEDNSLKLTSQVEMQKIGKPY